MFIYDYDIYPVCPVLLPSFEHVTKEVANVLQTTLLKIEGVLYELVSRRPQRAPSWICRAGTHIECQENKCFDNRLMWWLSYRNNMLTYIVVK